MHYLMVIGLMSIPVRGSGASASCSAESANDGDDFATGSLILNGYGGTSQLLGLTSMLGLAWHIDQ